MPNNKHKRAIRSRMAETGESYGTARLAYLAERGLPSDTTTSLTAAKKRDARVLAEYGAHLGLDLLPELERAATPGPVIEARSGGRTRAR